MILVKLAFYLAIVVSCLTIVDGSDINNVAPSDVNAQYLIDLGIKTNDEKLQAVGLAMKNIHNSDPCNEWTKWSICSANIFRYFGIKQRSRKCSNETELSLCRNRCPHSYQMTKLGYCIKKHLSKISHSEAEKQCKVEGGYLVSIDSKLKYEDIINTGFNMFNSFISIGGHRKNIHSPWLLEDGSEIKFFKWASGEPDNGITKLCLCMDNANGQMHDIACNYGNNFICEITV